MPKVYQYWAEPIDSQSNALLTHQLQLAATYRRARATAENLARALTRAIIQLPKEQRSPFYRMVTTAQMAHTRWVRSQQVKLGLNWGTYQAVDEAIDMSRRTTKLWGNDRAPLGINTFAAHDEGTVAVHIQSRELIASSLMGGTDTFVRIGAEKIGKSTLRARRAVAAGITAVATGAKNLNELMIRVGTDAHTQPIWARLYVLLHRPLPTAPLTWVKLTCRRVGPRLRWEVNFTVDEDDVQVRAPAQVRHTVGVDIGWRRVADGVRTAYWWGTDGAEGQLVIPDEVVQRDEKSDSLRAIRDRNRNEVRAAILLWREEQAEGTWARALASGAHLWTRQNKFVWFFKALDAARNEARQVHDGLEHATSAGLECFVVGKIADSVIYERWTPALEGLHTLLAQLIKQDAHLHAWEANNRKRQSQQVDGRVRELAVQLAKRYAAISIEAAGDVSGLVIKPVGAPDTHQRKNAAKKMHACAPSLIRQKLKAFAHKYGSIYVENARANTTRRCPACGEIREVVDQTQLVLTCVGCGLVEDQDRSAARNLVHLALLELAGGVPGPVQRPPTKQLSSTRSTRRRVVVITPKPDGDPS